MDKTFDEEKEFNPKMQFDAMIGGIEEGGLRSKSTIATIPCYIVANTKEKITAKNIIDAMVEGKIANYFEICNAIANLIKKGFFNEDLDGTLSITPECRQYVNAVQNDLPLTVREKSIELCRKIAAKEIYKKENKVEIEELDKGYIVTMHVSDKTSDFMTLSLTVPTAEQAQLIKGKFHDDPVSVYENLMNSIFNE